MDVKIRDMIYEDMENVISIIKEVFISWDIKSAINSILFHFEMKKVGLWDGRKNFVICINNKIIGFGGYGIYNPDLYYLSWIGIKKKYQRKGLGEYLLNELLNKIKEEGGKEVVVEAGSNEYYTTANKLYEKLGFVQKFVIKDFWNKGDDLILYYKKLA